MQVLLTPCRRLVLRDTGRTNATRVCVDPLHTMAPSLALQPLASSHARRADSAQILRVKKEGTAQLTFPAPVVMVVVPPDPSLPPDSSRIDQHHLHHDRYTLEHSMHTRSTQCKPHTHRPTQLGQASTDSTWQCMSLVPHFSVRITALSCPVTVIHSASASLFFGLLTSDFLTAPKTVRLNIFHSASRERPAL